MAEKILRMSVGLVVGVWVARYLGPEKFGLLSFAQSFVFLFSAIATLGLDNIVVRELVKDEAQRDVLLGTAFFLKLIGAVLVLPLIALAVQLTSNDYYTNLLIFIIASSTIFQSFNVIDFYYQSKVLSKYVAFSNTISLLCSSIIKIALIASQAPLIAFALVAVFEFLIIALGLFWFYTYSSKLSLSNWRIDVVQAKYLLTSSWPLIFSGVALMIQARADQIMLKELANVAEVGLYSVALRLVETFGFIPMLLYSTFFPAIQNAKLDSDNLYKFRLLNFYRLNFLLFLVVAIPLYFFSESIVRLLYGVEYINAGALLSLMSLRLFFTNMGVARGAFILSENLIKYSMFTMVIGTTTNVVLNYFWIPVYGSSGAITATLFSFFVTIYLIDALYMTTRFNIKLQLISIVTFFKIKNFE